MSAEEQFEKLTGLLTANKAVVLSQMFGKPCLKVNGKAFLALHKACLVFKLTGEAHKQALMQTGATLWDPSGKGRPMKQWIAIPIKHLRDDQALAEHALAYVAEQA